MVNVPVHKDPEMTQMVEKVVNYLRATGYGLSLHSSPLATHGYIYEATRPKKWWLRWCGGNAPLAEIWLYNKARNADVRLRKITLSYETDKDFDQVKALANRIEKTHGMEVTLICEGFRGESAII